MSVYVSSQAAVLTCRATMSRIPEKVTKERNYKFRRGTTDWKRDREVVRSFVVSETVRPIGVGGGDAMDTS